MGYSNKRAKVLLNTKIERYDIEKREFIIKGEKHKFDIVVSTISPDVFFDSVMENYHILKRFFLLFYQLKRHFQRSLCFLYYAEKAKLQDVEYKKLTRYKEKMHY